MCHGWNTFFTKATCFRGMYGMRPDTHVSHLPPTVQCMDAGRWSAGSRISWKMKRISSFDIYEHHMKMQIGKCYFIISYSCMWHYYLNRDYFPWQTAMGTDVLWTNFVYSQTDDWSAHTGMTEWMNERMKKTWSSAWKGRITICARSMPGIRVSGAECGNCSSVKYLIRKLMKAVCLCVWGIDRSMREEYGSNDEMNTEDSNQEHVFWF